jgi:hypothetical protein
MRRVSEADGGLGEPFPRRAVLGAALPRAPHRTNVHHHRSPPASIAALEPEKMVAQPTLDRTPEQAIDRGNAARLMPRYRMI